MNVGNSETDARDSIVVLTHTAWVTIVTSASKVSYDLQTKTWHSWLTFLLDKTFNRGSANLLITIMIQAAKLIEIKNILGDMRQMPYGLDRSHKILPPNPHHYGQLINRLIDCLQDIEHPNIMEIESKIISIRDNQLRELLVNNRDSFVKYGVSEEMAKITGLIEMYIGELLV